MRYGWRDRRRYPDGRRRPLAVFYPVHPRATVNRFLDSLETRNLGPAPGGWFWGFFARDLEELTHDLRFETDGETYTVPAGFVTDGASVPRIPFVWFLVGGIGAYAAAVHDWLYHVQTVSKWQADRIFYYALRTRPPCGARSAGPIRAWIMWAGLLIGGWPTWLRRRKETL